MHVPLRHRLNAVTMEMRYIGEHRLVRSRSLRSLYILQEQYFALRDVTNMIEIIRFLMDFRESGDFFAGAYSILFHEAILTLQ